MGTSTQPPEADREAASEAVLPPGVGVTGPTAWQRLDPLTKLSLSVTTIVAVVVLGGVVGPAYLWLAAVLVPALLARVASGVLRTSLLLALPLAVSAALVNLLFTPLGADPLLELGPLRVTGEGLEVATEVAMRVLVMAGAVTLYYRTTRPAELVASLQAHGAPARLTFVVHHAVAMIPRIVERAGEVAEAQRARGLDSEGSLARRLRGLGALAGPVVLGAVDEADARAMALEMRGFTRPGRHTLLWAPSDDVVQRLARWALVAAVALLVGLRLVGR
jgi:energy-coupling factor transport system permease protein